MVVRVEGLEDSEKLQASQIKVLNDTKAENATVTNVDDRVKVLEEEMPKKGLLEVQNNLTSLALNTEFRTNAITQ